MEKPIYQKWLDRVRYDMDTAEAMFATRRYIYVVFMCQQALEKCFKSLMASKGMEIIPVHNLRRLSELTEVVREMSKEDLRKIDFLSQFYLNARYKEDIEELSSQVTPSLAKEFIDFTGEKVEWLTQKIKP
ncbi:MAG: HEPN domain-containing protein [bacterium]